MPDHWKTALEHLPFIAMVNGAPKINWWPLVQTGVSGLLAGLVASQVMVVRLEERVASHEQRLNACESNLAEHIATTGEAAARMRERIATCEAKIK